MIPAEAKIQNPIVITHDIPMLIKQRGIEMRLVIGGGTSKVDPILIKALSRAHAWYDDLISGSVKTVAEIAAREGSNKSYIRYLINLVFLAPEIIESIIAGQQPIDLTVEKLLKHTNLPLDWAGQRRILGFA